jgi:CRISPR-associated protein Cmr4
VSVWKQSALLGIYTLSPTHYGTGQTTGAVDLPIARDNTTGFPVLPATGIKGVARDALEQAGDLDRSVINDLFGPELDGAQRPNDVRAGRLAFTEARLLAFPVRSLNRPFLHLTCPLILEHLRRDLGALGLPPMLGPEAAVPRAADERVKALVSDPDLGGTALVLEDLVYAAEEVGHLESVATLADQLGTLVPAHEKDTRARLQAGLVIIPDQDFGCLMETAIPVQARIKLTAGKTTADWSDPDSGSETDDSGNLWYEESLPPDRLLVAFVGERRQRSTATGAGTPAAQGTLDRLLSSAEALGVVQMGGNESVGQGLCLWTLLSGKTGAGHE